MSQNIKLKSNHGTVTASSLNSTYGSASNYTTTTGSIGSNIYYSPNTTSDFVINGGVDYAYYKDSDATINCITDCLKENEILELLRKIIERGGSKEDISSRYSDVSVFIRKIFSKRHFSENAILEFIDYLDEDTIKIRHSGEYYSGEYSALRLYFETKRN